MEISELTGLPELPEGEFWRIEESRTAPLFSMFTENRKAAFVSIVHKFKVTTVRDKSRHLPWPFENVEFVWGRETYVEDAETVLISVPVLETKTVPVDVFDDSGEKIGVRDEVKDRHISGDDLTPELILTACRAALVLLEQRTKSRGYLGDYPPKKLEA